MATTESTRVVNAALIGNLLVALTKVAAALVTGSSAMRSEAVHSAVDTGNELVLLYGMRKAARPPDADHPFGHGREIYFWSFIVALLFFALGAVVSVYQGLQHLREPVEITRPFVNYVVLGLALLFEGGSWRVAFKHFRATKGEMGYFEALRHSKDPTTFTVLAEDTGAVIGILIALGGTVASHVFGRPELDGMASIGIGILLALIALVLARETKGLLIGEPARSEITDTICRMAGAEPGIQRSNGLFTVHMGPHQVVAALSVDFKDDLSAREVERIVASLEDRVRKAHPEVVSLLIKPQKPERADFKESAGHDDEEG